jgi:DNA-binding phage protein
MSDIEQLRRLDPTKRYHAATQAMDAHRRALTDIAALRAQAVAELVATGSSVAEIAEQLGVTRQTLYRTLREHGDTR